MEIKDNNVIEIIEMGGASGLEEALQRKNGGKKIRVGDLPPEAQQVAQQLINVLESNTATNTRNIGSAGLEIKIDGAMVYKAAPFKTVSKEAVDLKAIVFTKGAILPKDGPQREAGA